jgi:O-antigen/teichoic acid export membrane protein
MRRKALIFGGAGSTSMKPLPTFLRERLEGRPNLLRILTNVGWLFADRIVRMGVGLVIGVWIARYLGPDQFGVMNYALAFVGLFLPIATLGLESVVVRDIVDQPTQSHETLATAFSLKLVAGIATYGLALAMIVVLKPEAGMLHLLVAVAGVTLVLQSFDTFDFWFQSQVRSKYSVIARNTSFSIAAVVRVGLILSSAGVVAFVAASALEAALTAVALFYVYRIAGAGFPGWQVTRARAARLLRTSWPLMFAGMAVAIYLRIDQIMLGEIVDEGEVGLYAAAVRISEVWYFVPTAIVSSLAPTLIRARKTDAALYRRRTQQLLNSMALLGYSVAIPTTFLSGPLVSLLYGTAYEGAGPILAVHIWAGLFVSLGVAQSAWLLQEGHTWVSLVNTAVGAVVNIAMNFLLIPEFGSLGAAIATLISYAVAVLALCFFYAPTRRIGYMILRSLALRT